MNISFLVKPELRLMINAVLHWLAKNLVQAAHFKQTATAIVITLVNSVDLCYNFWLLNQVN